MMSAQKTLPVFDGWLAQVGASTPGPCRIMLQLDPKAIKTNCPSLYRHELPVMVPGHLPGRELLLKQVFYLLSQRSFSHFDRKVEDVFPYKFHRHRSNFACLQNKAF
jgi:hypothetical protein